MICRVERAILAEPLANIVHLFRIASTSGFSRLAIVGAGTMGSLCLQVGRRLGCRRILVGDVNDQRLAVMSRLGAEFAVRMRAESDATPVIEIAENGYDMVIDASGSQSARQMAFTLCCPGGMVCLLGLGSERSELEFAAEHSEGASDDLVVRLHAFGLQALLGSFDRRGNRFDALDRPSTRWRNGQEAFDTMTDSPGPPSR